MTCKLCGHPATGELCDRCEIGKHEFETQHAGRLVVVETNDTPTYGIVTEFHEWEITVMTSFIGNTTPIDVKYGAVRLATDAEIADFATSQPGALSDLIAAAVCDQ
jgi:hypothetical protein